jgi:hypothetical protein
MGGVQVQLANSRAKWTSWPAEKPHHRVESADLPSKCTQYIRQLAVSFARTTRREWNAQPRRKPCLPHLQRQNPGHSRSDTNPKRQRGHRQGRRKEEDALAGDSSWCVALCGRCPGPRIIRIMRRVRLLSRVGRLITIEGWMVASRGRSREGRERFVVPPLGGMAGRSRDCKREQLLQHRQAASVP